MDAATCRYAERRRLTFEASHMLTLGEPLPTLPLWLGPDRVLPLDLEASYEKACHDLWMD